MRPQIAELLEKVPGVVIAGGAARAELCDDAPEPTDIDLFLLEGTPVNDVARALIALGYEDMERLATEFRAQFTNY